MSHIMSIQQAAATLAELEMLKPGDQPRFRRKAGSCRGMLGHPPASGHNSLVTKR